MVQLLLQCVECVLNYKQTVGIPRITRLFAAAPLAIDFIRMETDRIPSDSESIGILCERVCASVTIVELQH